MILTDTIFNFHLYFTSLLGAGKRRETKAFEDIWKGTDFFFLVDMTMYVH